MSISFLALLFAAAVPTTSSPAKPPQVENPIIGKTSIAAPLPSGFCVPEGNEAVGIAMVNAADTMNDTPMALVSCGSGVKPMDDYCLFKSPKQAAAVCFTSINRKVLTINHFERASAQRSQAALLAHVRAIADRMIAANEK